MKRLLFVMSFTVLFADKAFAQQTNSIEQMLSTMANQKEPCLPVKEVINHIGSDVYTCDTIAGYKIINSSLKLLYIGGNYPNQIITVIIKGKQANKDLKLWNSGMGHFYGKAFMYKGRPAIVIIDALQTGTQIQI